jgi:monofunctional biosynthetic peptidoglycan transglycosylase
VLFSLAGTGLILYAAHKVFIPINQVKRLARENPVETGFMTEYRNRLKAEGKPDSLVQIFIPLDSISPNLVNAVIASEDDAFYIHPGIDLNAIVAAYEYNRSQGKIVRGGSTLTQQLAKNLFLSKEKTFGRKYGELMYTGLLEAFLGKKRILELYLNYAEWGKNRFGCEAASQYYYKKSSRDLSVWEASRLTAVLAMPEKANPLNPNSTFVAKRVQVMADNLYIHGRLTDSQYTSLTGAPPPVKPFADSSAADSNGVSEPTDSARITIDSSGTAAPH